MEIEKMKSALKNYDGPELNIMEICGSHTEAIAKFGIPSLLSPKIHLLSGPGCPVCVTTSSYIDKLIELSLKENTCVVTFGDLIRVPGSKKSLSQAKGEGARVEMVYSPMDILPLAQKEPETTFVFAAVGFETTTPVYAMLMDAISDSGIENASEAHSLPKDQKGNRKRQSEKVNGQGKYQNIRLLTSIKTMPEVISYLMESGAPIDGFLAPGHVSVVTGSKIYEDIAERYGIPFGVSGFRGEELLVALYGLVAHRGQGVVKNYYPSVVTEEGNVKAQEMIRTFFQKTDATWRGMGKVTASGKILRKEYRKYDAGSEGLEKDEKINPACQCDKVLMGKKKPRECPLFGKVCTPMHPQGACMVSTEGSCFSYFANKRED